MMFRLPQPENEEQRLRIEVAFDKCFQEIWGPVEKRLMELWPELLSDDPDQQSLYQALRSAYRARLHERYTDVVYEGCFGTTLKQNMTIDEATEVFSGQAIRRESYFLECVWTQSDMLWLLCGDGTLMEIRNMANRVSLMAVNYLETPPDQRKPLGFRERRRLKRELTRLIRNLPAWATTDAEEYVLSIRNDIAVLSGKRSLPGIGTLNLMGHMPDYK